MKEILSPILKYICFAINLYPLNIYHFLKKILAAGLKYSLATSQTSYIAVSRNQKTSINAPHSADTLSDLSVEIDRINAMMVDFSKMLQEQQEKLDCRFFRY